MKKLSNAKIEKMKEVVETAGADWVGIETIGRTLKPPREDLVLFNDRTELHSTQALPVSEFSMKNVMEKLQTS